MKLRTQPSNAFLDTIRLSLRYAPVPFIGLALCGAITGGVVPLTVFAQSRVYDGAVAILQGKESFAAFVPALLLLAFAMLFPSVVSTLRWSVLQPDYLLHIRINLRRVLVEKCMRMKLENFENADSVDSLDQVYNNADSTLRHMASLYIPSILGSVISISGFSRFLVEAAWWLPLTVILPYVLNEFLTGRFWVTIYDIMVKNYKHLRMAEFLTRYMRSRDYVKEMKLFRAFRWMSNEYVSRLHAYNRMYETHYVRNMGAAALIFLMTDTCRIANVFFILVLYLRGTMSIGMFIALAGQVFSYHVWFGIGGFQLHKYIFEHYYKVMNFPDESCGEIDTIPTSPNIEFRDVSFKYPGTDTMVVDSVSFSVASGERLSIAGENGAGKSTLIKLLLGLYEPERGEILVNGRNIHEYSKEARSGLFSPVFQDFIRYNLTLRESISLGSLQDVDSDSKLNAAAQKGGIQDVVNRLGWDQQIGREFEGGTDLSGGEWQRLALSRAFLGDKPVVLLDEPTSQLDPMAEARLYEGFAESAKGKTTILVTHRLGSTKITDRILVFEKGSLIEEGTHGQLLALDGTYAKMFEAQKQWYTQGEGRL